jgi:type III secretory pathway component EscU
MRNNGTVSLSSMVFIVSSNAIILLLIWWVFRDYAYRAAYWRSMGFTPSTAYHPFSFVTSAIRGSTFIQGQLTIDWTQVLGAVLVIMDAAFLIGALRRRSGAEAAPAQFVER